MARDLPAYIDPQHLAERGQGLRGTLSSQTFSRITAPYRAGEPVDIDLQFGLDGDGRVYVQGSIKTELAAICQRCLGTMRFPVVVRVDHLIVGEQEAALLDENETRDFLVANGEPLALTRYVEDEILLAVPMVPMHESRDCGFPDAAPGRVPSQTSKPFAGLAGLLSGRRAK